MKGKLLLLLGAIGLTLFSSQTSAYREVLIENRGGKPIRVIKVILDGQDYVVASPALEGGASIEELTKKVGGNASINGAFFCPKDYSYCGGKTFSNYERVYLGDGASRSKFRGDTSIRAIFGFDKEGEPLFVQKNMGNHDEGLRSDINKERLYDLYFGIGNFPVLLIEGEDVTIGSQLYIDSKLTGKANRNFICSTEDGSTIYMGVVGLSSIRDMAPFIKEEFGCYNALSLDAGASTAMIYDGNVLDKGSRTQIMDAFVVLTRDEYIKLTGLTPPKKEITKAPYSLSQADQTMITKLKKICDLILKQYGSDYKSKIISLFRDAVSKPNITESKKAIYNQVLIYLFTKHKM